MKVPKSLEEKFRELRAEKERKRNSTPYSGGHREAYIRNDVPSVQPMYVPEPTCTSCAYAGKNVVMYKGKPRCQQCLSAILKSEILSFGN